MAEAARPEPRASQQVAATSRYVGSMRHSASVARSRRDPRDQQREVSMSRNVLAVKQFSTLAALAPVALPGATSGSVDTSGQGACVLPTDGAVSCWRDGYSGRNPPEDRWDRPLTRPRHELARGGEARAGDDAVSEWSLERHARTGRTGARQTRPNDGDTHQDVFRSVRAGARASTRTTRAPLCAP